MGKMTWEKLITVNYKGGLSGDFFSNLLCDNFDNFNEKNYDKTKHDRQKFAFARRDVFEQRFKSLIDIRDHRRFSVLLTPFFSHNYDNFYKTLHEMYKDEPLEVVYREIADLMYSLYYHKFLDGRYKVSNFHNITMDSIALSSMFPGSKNIVLTCNDSYYPLSRILFFYKNIINDYEKHVNITKETFDEFIEHSFFKIPDYHRHKEHPVDVYELIFNGKNYDKDLSKFLQTTITLDKKQIQKYRNDHIELFKKFDVDPYKTYEKKAIYGIIVDTLRLDERFRFD
jgi:hypothetical protein